MANFWEPHGTHLNLGKCMSSISIHGWPSTKVDKPIPNTMVALPPWDL